MLPKKTQTVFSPWQFVGIPVLKALDEWGKVPSIQAELPITGCQLVAILVTAINPPEFLECVRNNPKAGEFVRLLRLCHTTKPKLTKRLMALMKKEWNDQSSISKIVARYLTEWPWQVPPVWKNGKIIKDGILRVNLQDTELQAMFDGQTKRFKISAEADTIKKARKRINQPSWYPCITPALLEALRELTRLGFYTGHGT